MNSLTSICFYDSLGKEGSLLFFLFVIIFIFPILKKRLGGGNYITKMLLPACGSLSRALEHLWKFKLFYQYHTKTGSRYREGAKISRGDEWPSSSQDAPTIRSWRTLRTNPSQLEPWHCRNSSHFT